MVKHNLKLLQKYEAKVLPQHKILLNFTNKLELYEIQDNTT